jgi:uncharacterized LabA/DUF88 family protein
MSTVPPERVVAYIDGFNLYFGLRDSKLQRYLWLNIRELAANLLLPGQQLVVAKYFTSRISGAKAGSVGPIAQKLNDKRKRQLNYLEALDTLTGFQTFFGHFLDKPSRCFACGNAWVAHEEKMTDVNIATEMLADAYQNRFDVALLISADSDLVPPVKAIRKLFASKRVIVAFPPGRSSAHLKQAANASLTIGRGTLKNSQFPDRVTKPDGFVLQRPATWK